MPPHDIQTVSMVDYLQVVARRSRMIFNITAVTAVVTAAVSLALPNIYSARAMLLPAQEDKGLASALTAQLGGLVNLAGGSVGSGTTADLYVSMLKSETIKDSIIDRLKLGEVYEKAYREDVYKVIDGKTSIDAGKKDGIITIVVDDKDPKMAADIANAFTEELQKLVVRLNIAGAGENRTFLQERLARARADLALAEEALKVFQVKNKTVQMSEQAKATITGIAELKAAMAVKEVELSTASRSFTDASQEVKNLKAAIANLRSQIARFESGTGGGAVPGLGSLANMGEEYVRLMREFKAQESIVELLTKQFEMAKFSEAKNVSLFQVLQKAKVPARKSKPHRAKLVMMATFSMFFVSIVAAFSLEYVARMPEQEKLRWKEMMASLPFFGKLAAKS